MASAIHYKFKANPVAKKVSFSGNKIDVWTLKQKIIKNENLNSNEVDLQLMNQSSLKVYRNEDEYIERNTQVQVKRIPPKNHGRGGGGRPPVRQPTGIIIVEGGKPTSRSNTPTINLTDGSSGKNSPLTIPKTTPTKQPTNISSVPAFIDSIISPRIPSSLMPMTPEEIRNQYKRIPPPNLETSNQTSSIPSSSSNQYPDTINNNNSTSLLHNNNKNTNNNPSSPMPWPAEMHRLITNGTAGGSASETNSIADFSESDSDSSTTETEKIKRMMRSSDLYNTQTNPYGQHRQSNNRNRANIMGGIPLGSIGATPDSVQKQQHQQKQKIQEAHEQSGGGGGGGNRNRTQYPKAALGIPRTMYVAAEAGDPGAYLTMEGNYVTTNVIRQAVLNPKKERINFEDDNDEPKEAKEEKYPVPDHLTCPLDEGLMKNPVILACCNTSFSDEPITKFLTHKGFCPVCKAQRLPGDLIPDKEKRKEVNQFLNRRSKMSNHSSSLPSTQHSHLSDTSNHPDTPKNRNFSNQQQQQIGEGGLSIFSMRPKTEQTHQEQQQPEESNNDSSPVKHEAGGVGGDGGDSSADSDSDSSNETQELDVKIGNNQSSRRSKSRRHPNRVKNEVERNRQEDAERVKLNDMNNGVASNGMNYDGYTVINPDKSTTMLNPASLPSINLPHPNNLQLPPHFPTHAPPPPFNNNLPPVPPPIPGLPGGLPIPNLLPSSLFPQVQLTPTNTAPPSSSKSKSKKSSKDHHHRRSKERSRSKDPLPLLPSTSSTSSEKAKLEKQKLDEEVRRKREANREKRSSSPGRERDRGDHRDSHRSHHRDDRYRYRSRSPSRPGRKEKDSRERSRRDHGHHSLDRGPSGRIERLSQSQDVHHHHHRSSKSLDRQSSSSRHRHDRSRRDERDEPVDRAQYIERFGTTDWNKHYDYYLRGWQKYGDEPPAPFNLYICKKYPRGGSRTTTSDRNPSENLKLTIDGNVDESKTSKKSKKKKKSKKGEGEEKQPEPEKLTTKHIITGLEEEDDPEDDKKSDVSRLSDKAEKLNVSEVEKGPEGPPLPPSDMKPLEEQLQPSGGEDDEDDEAGTVDSNEKVLDGNDKKSKKKKSKKDKKSKKEHKKDKKESSKQKKRKLSSEEEISKKSNSSKSKKEKKQKKENGPATGNGGGSSGGKRQVSVQQR